MSVSKVEEKHINAEQIIDLENKIRELNYHLRLLERDTLMAKELIEKKKKKKLFKFKIPLR